MINSPVVLCKLEQLEKNVKTLKSTLCFLVDLGCVLYEILIKNIDTLKHFKILKCINLEIINILENVFVN